MSWLHRWFNRMRNLLTRSRIDCEIAEELAAHLDMRAEHNETAGMDRNEARRKAHIRFGNATVIRERTAEIDVALSLERFWADVRFALRQLRRAPGFSITTILILSLGIGACTAIFSAVKPILIDPLPYPQARRLMMLWEAAKEGQPLHTTVGTFYGLQERSHSFAAIAVLKPWQPAIASAANQSVGPERLDGQRVSAAFFRTLGIAPRLGRDFDASEDRVNGPSVVILSDRLWHRRFAADPGIVGHEVRLNDTLFTVVGVMPADFEDVLEPAAELWAPLQYDVSLPPDGREWGHHLRMVARLREGVNREQARGEADAILAVLARLYPKGYESTGGAPAGILVNPLQGDLTLSVRPALFAIAGATLLVLVIACVNVTNLLLARSGQRRAEFAMRAALGAARGRLTRQLLTESLLLAGLGGIVGLGIALAGVRALVVLSPPGLPRLGAIGFDSGVFFFALGIVALTGLVVGLVPAIQSARQDLQTAMRETGHTISGRRHWTRSALVVSEVALAMVLLICAGLLLRSMQKLLATDPGFDAGHLLTMQVQASGHRYSDFASTSRLFDQARERVQHMPGVVAAGFTSQLPLSGESDVYGIEFDGQRGPGSASAFRYAVSPAYLEAMRIPLLRGRLLNEGDKVGAPGAVLLSEALARRVFAGGDPIGKRLRVGPDVGHADRPWATVVGVVGNVKQESLAVVDEDAFYLPAAQWAWADPVQSLVVRTSGDPAAMASLLRNAIWSIDPDVPVVRVTAMSRLLTSTEAERHFVLMLFAAYAIAGLILAATGIYGVLSGSVTERTREIGVRAALGASRAGLLSLVLRQGMTLAVAGVAFGLAGAAVASRGVAALLFGISVFDPLTYCGVAVILLCIVAVACLLPARRAATIDPMQALRSE